MAIYDKIDPKAYDARAERMPSLGYLRNHWHPVITGVIDKYCQNKTVVDLGCGTGTFTTWIANCAKRTLGADISKVMLTYAKSKHKDLNFLLADVHHLPLKGESIDAVFAIGLFEYIHRVTVLREIKTALRLGGVCIIRVPNKYSLGRLPDKVICKVLRRKYFCDEPSYKEMLRLFRQEGFRLIESRMDDGLIWLPRFLDRWLGREICSVIEKLFTIFGRNPFSNIMLFITEKEG